MIRWAESEQTAVARKRVGGFLRMYSRCRGGWVTLLSCPRCPGYRCLQNTIL